MNIKISILMPFYNAEMHLSESIQSILNQTFIDFELLAIDDGSTDNSVKVVQSFNDKRIRLFTLKHNFIESLNFGLKNAQGKYIARMDADDIMLPNRLQVQYAFMEDNNRIDVCGSSAEVFGSENGIFGSKSNRGIIQYESNHGEIITNLLLYCNIVNPTVIFRKSTLEKFKVKYLNYDCAEDYKFWTDLALAGANFANIPQVLLLYRSSLNQITNKYYDKMLNTSYDVRIEYAEDIINNICEKDANFYPIFQESIKLLDLKILDFNSFCRIVYHIYRKHLCLH